MLGVILILFVYESEIFFGTKETISVRQMEDFSDSYTREHQKQSTKYEFKTNIIPIVNKEDITENSKILYHCLDVYGNIVDLYIPYTKINNRSYWQHLAQEYKIFCDRTYMPITYSCLEKSMKEIKKLILNSAKNNSKYCFYNNGKLY